MQGRLGNQRGGGEDAKGLAVGRSVEGVPVITERRRPVAKPDPMDEAFLDVTGSEHLFGPAAEIARQIKQAIGEEVRLVASVGVAPNKFLAKIASDLKKPDALVVVESDKVQEFLDPLPVERLWGVGKQSSRVFERLGIRTIGQLRQWPRDVLQSRFGSSGEYLWQLAHGIDDRPVVPEREAKSISHETTFEEDIDDREILRAWLVDLTEQVGCRLRRHGLRGRTVQLKVRFADFSLITRSCTLAEATAITDELWRAADELLCQRLPAGHLPVRLLGMGVTGLDDRGPAQRMLFDREEREKQARLDAVADQLKERFGSGSLRRGSSLRVRRRTKNRRKRTGGSRSCGGRRTVSGPCRGPKQGSSKRPSVRSWIWSGMKTMGFGSSMHHPLTAFHPIRNWPSSPRPAPP